MKVKLELLYFFRLNSISTPEDGRLIKIGAFVYITKKSI